MSDDRLQPLPLAIERAFREHGQMTVKRVAAIVNYHVSAIYPIVKPPKYVKVRRDTRRNRDGKRGGTVWGLKEVE